MPLNKKGKKILKSMKEQYGSDAEKVFYASKNKGVIKNVEKKIGGGLSGGKRFGPPPEKGPDSQGLKIKKAMGGVLAVKDLFERSQTARDIGGQLGLAPRFLSDKYNKEAQEIKEQLEAAEQKKSMGLKKGGMSCPYRRGGKTEIQGVSKIQVKGQKFTGVK